MNGKLSIKAKWVVHPPGLVYEETITLRQLEELIARLATKDETQMTITFKRESRDYEQT